MFKIVCVTARALCPGDFLAQLERVAAAGGDKIILREKDLNAIEPLFKVHLYGGMTRMGGKIYSDEYRIYFNHS